MNKPLVIGNWKSNPATLQEAKRLFNLIKKGTKNFHNAEVVICPPFVYLLALGASAFAKGYGGLALGSQDCFWEEKGPFTGEISPLMLKNLGCEYVIIGHSERRKNLNETDEMINKKIKAALKAGLKPILCIGETEEEKRQGKTKQVLKTQLKNSLKGVLNLKSKIHVPYRPVLSGKGRAGAGLNLIVMYEPVWAISTSSFQKNCSPKEALSAILFLKKIIAQIFNKKIAKNISFVYGGSVNSQNAADFLRKKEINGVLPGAASLNADEFVSIVKQAQE
jgi:triosephosphate isomerase